jgi:hypothetical protein
MDDVVMAKLAGLAAPAYPGIVAEFETLMRVDRASLARPWRAIVDRISEEPARA